MAVISASRGSPLDSPKHEWPISRASAKSAVAEAECGAIGISLAARCLIAAACGHELSVKLYPSREIVRRSLPIGSRTIWYALRRGMPLGGDGLLLVRIGQQDDQKQIRMSGTYR
jgi:hypothetical protein